MRCTDCHCENRTSVKFCTQCGTPLFLFCAKCGFETMEGDIFCGDCGTRLPYKTALPALQEKLTDQTAAPSPTRSSVATGTTQMESARKHVTVLFADISGFTAMSEKMDPEDVTILMNGCLTQLADTVVKYEGYVDKFIGDCIMAIFGAPIAHENDPELAVRAALEMKRVTEEYNKALPIKLEKPLMLHTGINSGLVVAGGVGSDQKMDYTVMGDTVNLASRLESIAEGGQVFISKYTHNLVRDIFEFFEHDPIKVKGKKAAIPVYEPVSIRSIPRKERTGRRTKTHLIGRSEEMDVLKERIDRLLAGEQQVVLLKSDAGIGKSRIQMEIESHLADKQVQEVIYGRCHSFSQSTSYFLFSEILKGLFDIDSEDLAEAMAEKLASNLPVLTGADPDVLSDEAREAIVFLGRILGLDLGDDYDIPVQHMDAQDVRESIFRSIKWLFEQLAERNPLILVLEDLHYADNITLDVIDYLSAATRDRPIMLLLSLRSEKGHPPSDLSLSAQENLGDRCKEIALDRLSPQEGDELVKSMLQTEEVPEAILDMIRKRADGNPSYIEAIVQDLKDNAIIEVKAGHPLKILKAVDQIAIPDTIQGMVMSRIDRLPGNLKEILQAASVIGPVFKYELLKQVVDDAQLEDSLQRLAEMDMLFESKSFPEIEYSFKSILIQEAAYSCLLHRNQRELHRVITGAIEGLYHDRLEDHYEVLAMHYHRAQDFAKAYECSVKSGMKAKKIYANQNAIAHFNDAIALSPQITNPVIPVADVYIALSEVYELTGDLDLAVEVRAKAIETLDDDLQKADSQRNIGRILEKKGNKEGALEIYKGVYRLLEDHPNSIEMGRLLMNESWVLNRMWQYEDAIEKCSQALELFESQEATEDIAQAYNNLAVFFESKGDLDLALAHNEKSLAIFLDLNNKRKLANVYLSLGYVYTKRNELETALECFEQSNTTMEKIGNHYGAGTALMAKGRCYIDMGRLDEAESVLTRSLRIHQDLDLKLKLIANELSLARVHLEKGDTQSARTYLNEARGIAVAEARKSDLAKISHLEAHVLVKEGQDPGAKFEEAIVVFKSLGREREAAQVVEEFESYKKQSGEVPDSPSVLP